MNCIDLISKQSKMSSYVVKHWKLRKTQNYKSNQIRINLHRFDVKTIKNVELRRKTFKTTQNYESHQITMNCIDLMSKRSNQRKTTKVIKFGWICIDLTSKRSKNVEHYVAKLLKKVIKLLMNCIDLTSKRSKKLSYVDQIITKLQKQNQITINLHRFDIKTIKNVELRRKTLKTTQNAKLQKQSNKDQFASIWRQNDQNNAKLRKWSNYNELHRFDVKTIKTT